MLQRRLRTLPRVAMTILPGTLGYPALHIATHAHSGDLVRRPDALIEAELDANLIWLRRSDGRVEYRLDASQSISRWLLSIAQGRTDEVIRKVVLARIAARCT